MQRPVYQASNPDGQSRPRFPNRPSEVEATLSTVLGQQDTHTLVPHAVDMPHHPRWFHDPPSPPYPSSLSTKRSTCSADLAKLQASPLSLRDLPPIQVLVLALKSDDRTFKRSLS
ncbi:hypothetical protein Ae201684P_022286 [Aphanomyces euteiches]|uniref:Uncharacterized protein n=1 Tax=Aphanomyces euteiches TaxID=100861 RepID=A0A6G0X679_9STRA|nr:hypothetical protein Ae201684_008102 [Aphanomyces euteiches]KAH9074479.1 hypothetical protein Ae201684P_022286 [Aphanomyces euteiches]